MIIQPLIKIYEKLGKFLIPFVLVLFFLFSSLLIFPNVQQRAVDYKEGQVAEKSIRANKTIENTQATEQKRQLAAESVTPEYTYDEDLVKRQEQLLKTLFSLIGEVKTEVALENESRQKAVKGNETFQAVTIDEQIALLKKRFEQVDSDDLTFYQKIPNSFYELIFSMTNTEIEEVETQTLAIMNAQMSQQVRASNLEDIKQNANDKISFLTVSNDQAQAIRYLINQGIVVNSVLNEKRTE